jgi:hypothetical protein
LTVVVEGRNKGWKGNIERRKRRDGFGKGGKRF